MAFWPVVIPKGHQDIKVVCAPPPIPAPWIHQCDLLTQMRVLLPALPSAVHSTSSCMLCLPRWARPEESPDRIP